MTAPRSPWRWPDWSSAEVDVKAGDLHESHGLEFKGGDYAITPGGRKEMAKDIAALAVDGGTLVIGLQEDKPTGRATALTPIAVQGVAERIDQACTYRIEPPLQVEIRDDLRDPADETRGLVLVDVPASPLAPHMVDGRYYGRDNRIARPLNDAEVLRLHHLRERDVDLVERELAASWKSAGRVIEGNGRLAAVAAHLGARRPQVLRDQLAGQNWWTWLQERQDASDQRIRELLAGTSPLAQLVYADWSGFSRSSGRNNERVAGGVAWRYERPGRCALSVEVLESGTVRLAADRLVVPEGGPGGETGRRILNQIEAMTMVMHMVGLMSEIAEQAGIKGTAGLGLVIDGTDGAIPTMPFGPARNNPFAYFAVRDGLSPFTADEYRQTTLVTTTELAGDLGPAMDRLFGPLLRSAGLGDPLRPAEGT